MNQKRLSIRISLVLCSIFLLLLLGACGGAASTDAAEGDAGAPATNRRNDAVPTMPAARFDSVGNQSGISETKTLTETTTTTEETAPDLALGERVYTNRCAECHGAQAEGGSAAALAGLTMAEADYVDLIRTGGDLGPDHLFGTRAVSENGLNAIYAYLQSLE